MGDVYTAQDPRLKRQVAIKFLTPDLTRDETVKQRFLQEAQAASALDHPNICTIERGRLALDEAVDIATQVGRGLAEAHGAGKVHQDIKPANFCVVSWSLESWTLTHTPRPSRRLAPQLCRSTNRQFSVAEPEVCSESYISRRKTGSSCGHPS